VSLKKDRTVDDEARFRRPEKVWVADRRGRLTKPGKVLILVRGEPSVSKEALADMDRATPRESGAAEPLVKVRTLEGFRNRPPPISSSESTVSEAVSSMSALASLRRERKDKASRMRAHHDFLEAMETRLNRSLGTLAKAMAQRITGPQSSRTRTPPIQSSTLRMLA
jgi:hypothetical protein